MKDEIDLLAAGDLLGSERHRLYDEGLQASLAATLCQPSGEPNPPTPTKRLLAQPCGFRSHTALQPWAEAMAPRTAEWLKEVTAAPRKTKRARTAV